MLSPCSRQMLGPSFGPSRWNGTRRGQNVTHLKRCKARFLLCYVRLAHTQRCATRLTEQAAFQRTSLPALSFPRAFCRSCVLIPLFLFSLTPLPARFPGAPFHTVVFSQLLPSPHSVQVGSSSPIRHIPLLFSH